MTVLGQKVYETSSWIRDYFCSFNVFYRADKTTFIFTICFFFPLKVIHGNNQSVVQIL